MEEKMDLEAKKLIEAYEAGKVSRRNFMRRAALMGVGFGSLSTFLAACGDNTATPAASATTAAASATTAAPAASATTAAAAAVTTAAAAAATKISGQVEIWSRETFSNGVRQPIINARLAEFEKANPGVTTKAQFLIFQESVQKTQAALAAGSPPEVGQQGPDVALSFAAAKNLLPLDDVVASIGKDKFVELQREAYVEYQGVTYGIPWYAETRVLMYHKDLLEKAGVQPPTTWDEWSAAAKKLSTGDQYGFIFGLESPGAGQFWIPLGTSAGGTVLDKDGKVSVNTQPFKDALTFASSFIKDKSMPEAAVTYKGAEVIKLFQLKKVAMIYTNGQTFEDIRGIDPTLAANIGAVTIPVKNKGDTSRSFLGGFHLFAFAKAKNPEGAKALIKYMYQNPWYSDYMQKTGGAALPVLKDSINIDFYQKDPIKKSMLDQLKTAVRYAGPVFGNTPYMGQAESQAVFNTPVINVITGKSTVDQAIADCEAALNKLKAAQ
jgi:ABC-type glycerol-3-phosphate transport system substrate-binding protein